MGFWQKYKLKKEKYNKLKLLKPGVKILVNCPNGYSLTIDGTSYYNRPCHITVVSNDPNTKKIWATFNIKESRHDFIFDYDSKELENYILLNINSGHIKEEVKKDETSSKEELIKKLAEAVKKEDYETATLINSKLKNI